MSNKILGQQSKQLNNVLSAFDKFYQPIGKKTYVYKFRKCSGSIYLTKYGEIPITTKSENYQQNFQIYTGKEPITVVWNNSINTYVDDNKREIFKEFQVGDYEVCYLSNSLTIDKNTTTKNLYEKEYVMSYLKYTVSLQSNTWLPDEDDINDYLYLIFDPKAKSYKWLEIINITPVYNEATNKLQYCDITFESINDKYSQTGKTILDFVQMGAIVEGYAFPKETHKTNGEIEVDLDIKFLDDLGCNSFQLDFTCGAALSSILIFGRRLSKKVGDNKYKVDTPHLLFLYDTQTPIISNFFYNQPNLNSYIGTKWQPTKQGIWQSYKDAFKANDRIGEYNILNQKEVVTGLKHDQATIRKTNPNVNTYTNWIKDKAFNLNFGDVFAYDTNPYIEPETAFNKAVSYVDFLNINAFANFASDVFDYDYKETKKWKATEVLGIFGGILDFVVGGLDFGWTTSNVLSQVPNELNLIVPCISYEDGMLALNNNAPLPLDVFYDDRSKNVLPTSSNVLTSWRFRLTDRVRDTSKIIENAPLGRGGDGIWDLKYVGQRQFEDGSWIFDDHRPLRLKLSTTTVIPPTDGDFNFIIDYVDFKAIASCDYRLTAYDKANNQIYSSINETNAKARGDIRIWKNATKFNYYEDFNTSGEVDYPNFENPPPPDLENISFVLTDFIDKEKENFSTKFQFSLNHFSTRNDSNWNFPVVVDRVYHKTNYFDNGEYFKVVLQTKSSGLVGGKSSYTQELKSNNGIVKIKKTIEPRYIISTSINGIDVYNYEYIYLELSNGLKEKIYLNGSFEVEHYINIDNYQVKQNNFGIWYGPKDGTQRYGEVGVKDNKVLFLDFKKAKLKLKFSTRSTRLEMYVGIIVDDLEISNIIQEGTKNKWTIDRLADIHFTAATNIRPPIGGVDFAATIVNVFQGLKIVKAYLVPYI